MRGGVHRIGSVARCAIADDRGVVLAFRAAMETPATSQVSGGLVRRIESEYREMPGLNLTVAQAQRLWGVEHATCVQVLTLLVTRRVLKRTPAGTYLPAR